MKLSDELSDLLEDSDRFVRAKGFEFVSPEIVLLRGLDYETPSAIFDICQLDFTEVRRDILKYLNKNQPPKVTDYSLDSEPPVRSVAYDEILEEAKAYAQTCGRDAVTVGMYLVCLFHHGGTYASYILKKNGLQHLALVEAITELESEIEEEKGEETSESEEKTVDESENFESEDSEMEDGNPLKMILGTVLEAKRNTDVLASFARNLTEEAKNGRLDALIGRDEEIERTIEILCRRTKNNPIHVGDAGVGKTSITEGLAQRIVEGKVPEFLKDAEIFSVEVGSLVAGTKYRGEFEKRLKDIISALQNRKKAILFIDEIHTIIGAGSGSSGNLDAANILKPALSKNNLRCIGSTTFEEYSKTFEKDRALNRRFQKIDILEPSREEAIKIMKGIAGKYEEYHRVRYSPESLTAAVDLSVQYFAERRLPDKAIDVIDEAGVYVRLHREIKNVVETEDRTTIIEEKLPVVTVNDVRKVISKNIRIPLENITSKERDKLRHLEDTMKEEIFGQDEAVKEVCTAVKKARAGFRNMDKPESSFLFVGPTGVGKTELAKTLANILGVNLLRFDMSEYQESYTISRLIGSAPGYTGFENGGLLTSAVLKDPHAVVLFDEIEKAHEDIYNTLLQVLDYGSLTDAQGRKANFKNCLIIFTSNAGARDMSRPLVGFSSGEKNDEKNKMSVLKDAVEKTFSPEFRNRLDKIIYFGSLSKEIAVSIAKKSVDKISQRLEAKKIRLSATDEVYEFIAENACSAEFGARNIQRFAEDNIASPLVDEILFGKLNNGGTILIDVKDGKISWAI